MNEQLINELCQKFHTTVDNLIPIYAKYAMGKAIGGCIICIVLIVISVLYFIYLKHYVEKEDICDWLDLPGHHIIASIIAIIILVICIIIFCINIYDYVMWASCPQMRFLDLVVNTVK